MSEDTNKNITSEELLNQANNRKEHAASPDAEFVETSNNSDKKPENLITELSFLAKTLKSFNRSISKYSKIYSNTLNTIKYAYDNSGPVKVVLNFLANTTSMAWGKYKTLFNQSAYKQNEEGVALFSPKNAVIFILASVFSLFVLYQVVINTPAFIRDFYHFQTAKEQTFYFGQPRFNTATGTYHVTACKDEAMCEGGDNALIFDIPDNKYLDMKYLLTRGKGYDAEHEIVSAFTSEYMKCTVTVKGEKPIIINYVFSTYKWFPKIIDKAVCTPILNINL